MLLNFSSPTSGSIYYDQELLGDLDATKVRRQMGVVLQDSNLLSGSVQENLLCGGMYTKEQIDKAIQLSGFDEVLKEMPMGLHTYLVENVPLGLLGVPVKIKLISVFLTAYSESLFAIKLFVVFNNV